MGEWAARIPGKAQLVHCAMASVMRGPGVREWLATTEAKVVSIDASSRELIESRGYVEGLDALSPSIVTANEGEAEALARVGWKPGAQTLYVVKRGSRATRVALGEWAGEVEVAPCEVVDTTGAGDGFIGGMLAGWMKGLGVIDSVKLGHEVARCVIGGHSPVLETRAWRESQGER